MRLRGKPNLRLMMEMRQELEHSIPKVVADLEQLGANIDASRLFVAVVANLLISPPHIAGTTLHDLPSGHERLAYHLYPFIGMSDKSTITPFQYRQCVEILEKLCIQDLMLDLNGDTGGQDAARDLAEQVRAFTKIVRGSAYPEQTEEEILSIQGPFEDWFAHNVGIGPSKAHAILWAIEKAQGRNISNIMTVISPRIMDMMVCWNGARQTRPRERTAEQLTLLQRFTSWEAAVRWVYEESLCELAPDCWPVSREDLQGEGMPPTEGEWNALLKLLGLTPQARAGMNDLVDAREYPLFVLPNERMLLVDISHALDILWERFDKAARTDGRFHDKRYRPVKAEWLEKSVTEYLGRIFPSSNIYQSLAYPDPDKSAGSTTELDIAVVWGPFLLLVEAKAKQFRLAAQLGDIAKLRTDLRDNIEDAFEQARRAVRYIASVDTPEFTELKTGRKLIVNKDDLKRTYLLTISLHELAGLATQMASLRDLNLFRDGEFPLSISAADLDTITQLCEGPDLLLHYIERRLDVQKNDPQVFGDELDMFGAYLSTRLRPDRIWEQGGKQYHQAMLYGWSKQFDHWMEYRRGEREQAPGLGLKVPDEIQNILQELRHRDDDADRWIAFALLDMPDDVLQAIEGFLRQTRQHFPPPGMFRRGAYQSGDVAAAFVASCDLPMSLLYERTKRLAHIEKYRRKLSKCVSFGIALNNPRQPFAYAYWIEGDWQYDEAMEQLLEQEPPMMPIEGSRMPGRNEECLCGSGKKFKKCCMARIEKARRSLS